MEEVLSKYFFVKYMSGSRRIGQGKLVESRRRRSRRRRPVEVIGSGPAPADLLILISQCLCRGGEPLCSRQWLRDCPLTRKVGCKSRCCAECRESSTSSSLPNNAFPLRRIANLMAQTTGRLRERMCYKPRLGGAILWWVMLNGTGDAEAQGRALRLPANFAGDHAKYYSTRPAGRWGGQKWDGAYRLEGIPF
jgi:hypothetical protein